jgi:hypothetical protein
MGSFKTWFVVGTIRFQKWFDIDILNFQFDIGYRYFGICFRDFWGYFKKNWAFSPKLMVTLLVMVNLVSERARLPSYGKVCSNLEDSSISVALLLYKLAMSIPIRKI